MKKTSYIILAFWATLFLLMIGTYVYLSGEKQLRNSINCQLAGDSTMVSRRLPAFRHLVVSVPELEKEEMRVFRNGLVFRGHLSVAPAEWAGRCGDLMEQADCDTLYASEPRLVCPRRVMDKLSFSTQGDTLRVALNLQLDSTELERSIWYANQKVEIDTWHLWITQPLQSMQVDLSDASVCGYYLKLDSLVWNGQADLALARSEVGALDARTSHRQRLSVIKGTHVGRFYGSTRNANILRLNFGDKEDGNRVDQEFYSGPDHELHLAGPTARHIVWQPE